MACNLTGVGGGATTIGAGSADGVAGADVFCGVDAGADANAGFGAATFGLGTETAAIWTLFTGCCRTIFCTGGCTTFGCGFSTTTVLAWTRSGPAGSGFSGAIVLAL